MKELIHSIIDGINRIVLNLVLIKWLLHPKNCKSKSALCAWEPCINIFVFCPNTICHYSPHVRWHVQAQSGYRCRHTNRGNGSGDRRFSLWRIFDLQQILEFNAAGLFFYGRSRMANASLELLFRIDEKLVFSFCIQSIGEKFLESYVLLRANYVQGA